MRGLKGGALVIFSMLVAGTDGFRFALAPAGSIRQPCCSSSRSAAGSMATAEFKRQRWTPADRISSPHMQVQQWVETAAAAQGRDPLRLEPLKPLPDVIRIRTLQVVLHLPDILSSLWEVPLGQSPAHCVLFCTLFLGSLRNPCAGASVHRNVTRVRAPNVEAGLRGG